MIDITAKEMLRTVEDICVLESELIHIHKKRLECAAALQEAVEDSNFNQQKEIVQLWAGLWHQAMLIQRKMEEAARKGLNTPKVQANSFREDLH